LAGELVGCEAAQRLEATGMVISIQEELDVPAQVVMAGVVVAVALLANCGPEC